jgi:hypothetical protein
VKPQEKSREIVIRMQFQQPPLMFEQAKYCALIAVDEIIDSIVIIDLTAAENQFTYWEQVKKEIEKL